MSEQAERLRQTLMRDGGSSETALKEVLRSELFAVFGQYMTVDDIDINVREDGIEVRVKGGNIQRVGFYCSDE